MWVNGGEIIENMAISQNFNESGFVTSKMTLF